MSENYGNSSQLKELNLGFPTAGEADAGSGATETEQKTAAAAAAAGTAASTTGSGDTSAASAAADAERIRLDSAAASADEERIRLDSAAAGTAAGPAAPSTAAAAAPPPKPARNNIKYAIIEINNGTISVIDKTDNLTTDKTPRQCLTEGANCKFALQILKKDCATSNDICIEFENSKYLLYLNIVTKETDFSGKLIDEEFLKPAASTTSASTAASAAATSGAAKTETPIVGGVRRGVDNVGNSCWANGIYQMLYDAEKFRNYIIDTNWDQDFFTNNKASLDAFVLTILTREEDTRKKELEDDISSKFALLHEDSPQIDNEELNNLYKKEGKANWDWLPKSISPVEYKNIFGHLLKQIFKHIRGDDIKITYETSLIPVLLFPDEINKQQDSREFINLLNTKAESLDLKKYFGVNQTETKYYLDGENKTKIKISNKLEHQINAILKFDLINKEKNDLSVQQMLNSKETEQIDDVVVNSLEELKKNNNSNSDEELQEIIIKSKVTTYNNIIPEYSDFSDYFLVSLSRVDISQNKIKTPVKLDRNLKIGETNFTLLGAVVHIGENGSGHYIYESIVANKECNDSNATNPAFTSYNEDFVETNWTILLYKKENSIAGGSSYFDMPMKTPVPSGSRKNRQQKSKKTKRNYYTYKK